jgi:allophanate hydrolase
LQIQQALVGLDAVLVPTTATTFRVSEVQADPLLTNARLGIYTNFTNLADLSAIAVPGEFRRDGLPAGLTLLGPAFSDERLLGIASRVHKLMSVTLGATSRRLSELEDQSAATSTRPKESFESPAGSSQRVQVAVVGAHLSSMPLNHQLTERGARLVRRARTSQAYRLFLLHGQRPQKPGLVRVKTGGVSIEIELWELPISELGSFVCEIPPPLGMGTIELADGSWEKGFICEPCALDQARDISEFGGFIAYMRQASGTV